jgi:hypothetical protein
VTISPECCGSFTAIGLLPGDSRSARSLDNPLQHLYWPLPVQTLSFEILLLRRRKNGLVLGGRSNLNMRDRIRFPVRGISSFACAIEHDVVVVVSLFVFWESVSPEAQSPFVYSFRRMHHPVAVADARRSDSEPETRFRFPRRESRPRLLQTELVTPIKLWTGTTPRGAIILAD